MSLERLPSSLMEQICEYIGLRDTWRLTRCNKALERLITRDCTSLWRHIDFSKLSHKIRVDTLTDKMLANVLSKVNSQQYVTTHLILNECYRLDGSGLRPLQHSTSLESVQMIAIRYSSVASWIVNTISRMLEVPMSHNLMDIALARNSTGRGWGEARHRLMQKLRARNYERAKEANTKCKHCQTPVVPVSSDGEPIDGSAMKLSTRCFDCHSFVCQMQRNGACPYPLFDCAGCDGSYCEACETINVCSKCAKYYCSCSPLEVCTGCDEEFCTNCERIMFDCDECDRHTCSACSVEIHVEQCPRCSRMLCSECDDFVACECCHKRLCSDCKGLHFCSEDGRGF